MCVVIRPVVMAAGMELEVDDWLVVSLVTAFNI